MHPPNPDSGNKPDIMGATGGPPPPTPSPNPDSGNKPDILFSLDVEREYGIPRSTQRVWACHNRYN
jgi:hypothetical protein